MAPTWIEVKSPDAHAPKIAEPTSTDSLSRGKTQGKPTKEKNICFNSLVFKLTENKIKNQNSLVILPSMLQRLITDNLRVLMTML